MRILFPALVLLFSFSVLAAAPCPSMEWTLVDESTSPYWVPTLQSIDFDEDGKLDLVGVSDGADLLWWKGAGDGTFGEPSALGNAYFMSNVVIADATGDGRLDVLVGVTVQGGTYLWTYAGTGSGRTQVAQPSVQAMHTIVAPNMDADPEAELVTSNGYGFTVYDRGPGGYTQTQHVDTEPLRKITSADFDADGRHDVAVATAGPMNQGSSPTDRVDVYFRNANGSFGTPVSLFTPQPWAITSGDVDGDGKTDIVAGTWVEGALDPGTITIFRNTGNRTFSASVVGIDKPQPPNYFGGDVMQIEIVDMDADTHADILVSVVNGSWLTTLPGLGDGTFRTPTFLAADTVYAQTNADFNGDGVRDLAVGTLGSVRSYVRSCTTQVSLYAESYMISVGQEATLRAQISGFHPGVAAPRGTVSLRKGQNELASAEVQADGWVTFNVSNLPAGDHDLYAVFSGNSELGGATSAAVRQRVSNTTSSLSIAVPPTLHGYAFVVDFHIPNVDYGYIEYSVDGGPKQVRYTSVPLTLTLAAGPHSITARYLGAVFRPKSDPVTVHFTTSKETPSIAFGGALQVRLGTAHQLTVTVSTMGTLGAPTGTVHLYENGTTLLSSAPLVNGAATFSRTFGRGSHALRAVYAGDANFNSEFADAAAEVMPNFAFALEARSLSNGIHISAMPMQDTNVSSLQLQRRVVGTGTWQNVAGFTGMTSGIDTAIARGAAYEYQMIGTLTGGTPIVSNTDSALFFTDDALLPASFIKRTHFTELATAVNLLRSQAGLAAFAFEANFTTPGLIRASHLTSLRTALMEARSALGMPLPATSDVSAAAAVKLLHVTETRDLAR